MLSFRSGVKVEKVESVSKVRSGLDDSEDVAFLHDQQVFTVDLDLGARPLAEQDLVAGLDVERRHLAVLGLGASPGGDDFAFLRLFLGGIGNDNAAGRLFLSLAAANRSEARRVGKGGVHQGRSRWLPYE